MKIVSYLNGIPPKNNNLQKPAILYNFIHGVNRLGDTGIIHTGYDIIDSDVGVLQGFVHEASKNMPHLKLRQNVLDAQKAKGGRTVIVDSNLFLYADTKNTHNYLRYSFDGVFPSTGFYFDTEVDATRWQKVSADHNISLKDYRTNGKHILLCLQRNGGWSMHGINVMDFCHDVIKKIRSFTDRPIVVRGHPGDKKAEQYLRLNYPRVWISPKGTPLQNDLHGAWATVVYNSSPGVASLVEGVPVFMMDPDPGYSQYSDVANTNLKRLEDPKMFDRQPWIEKLCMSHWKFDELLSGEAWEHMRKSVYLPAQ